MNPGLFCNSSVSLCLSSDILLPAILSLILSLERNPDASAKAMLGKLGLIDNIHFIIANKICLRIAMLSDTDLLFRNKDSHNLEQVL